MSDSQYTILLVEDEENDALLMKMAFKKSNVVEPLQWVHDGLEAIEYLNGGGIYADRGKFPFPKVVILDLKMPRMGGLELLTWLREHQEYRVLPTIIMTSSRHEPDIEASYRLGANTYMMKPSSFDELAKTAKGIYDYWAASVTYRINRPKDS